MTKGDKLFTILKGRQGTAKINAPFLKAFRDFAALGFCQARIGFEVAHKMFKTIRARFNPNASVIVAIEIDELGFLSECRPSGQGL